MSGILWEPSQQPDLVEALSSFATSALALSLAIPMFVVDLLCSLLISLCSLISTVLAPVLEVLGQGGTMLLAATGLEDTWSANHTLVSILSIYTATALVLQGSGTRLASRSLITERMVGERIEKC